MSDVHAVTMDTYKRGQRLLMRAAVAGSVSVLARDGTVELGYNAGDILLADNTGNVIVGPMSLAGAIDLAERVLEGDQRALTERVGMLALATAIIGFSAAAEPVQPEPVARQAVAHG